MDYKHKYYKYENKLIGGKCGKKRKIQFILFGDVMTGDNVWHYDNKNNKINFVDKLKKLGDIVILKPNYVNFMSYSDIEKEGKR